MRNEDARILIAEVAHYFGVSPSDLTDAPIQNGHRTACGLALELLSACGVGAARTARLMPARDFENVAEEIAASRALRRDVPRVQADFDALRQSASVLFRRA